MPTSTISALTGLPIEDSNYTPISVLLDNAVDVPVRYGLEHASIVYEAPVEGGLTRLLAIFASTAEVERLGPVRSLRPYFVDWASEYGGMLMHVGGSPDGLRSAARADNLVNIDEIGIHESYFQRTGPYRAPHTVFTSAASWRTLLGRYEIPTSSPASWRFAPAAPATVAEGERAQIVLEYSSLHSVGWVWDAERQVWLRFVNGDREYTASGDQVSATNVVVIEVEGRVVDAVGRWDFETIGSGPAFVYNAGREQNGRWRKESAIGRMLFLDSQSEEEIALQPGVTWIEVVPDRSLVEFKKFLNGN